MSASLKEGYRLSLQLSPEDRKRLADFLLHPPPLLNIQQIVGALEAHAGALRTLGVERIGVFGSYAQGSADPTSDIDILLRLSHASFRNFMRLRFYLEDLLAHPVDLVLEESLREELRQVVLGEVVYAQGL